MILYYKVVHEFLIRASDLILNNLRQNNVDRLKDDIPEITPLFKPLTHIMFHIEDTAFDQVSIIDIII